MTVCTWLARRLRALLDRYLGAGWMEDADDLDVWELVNNIPDEQLWAVRQHLKRKLVADNWFRPSFCTI